MKEIIKIDMKIWNFVFFFLEATLFFLFLFSFPFINVVFADIIGEPNATVNTRLTLGNVYPEISNVTLQDGNATLNLAANTTQTVFCVGLITDYDNESDISLVTGEFFNNGSSNYTGTDDNNFHYTNSSCNISYDTGGWGGVANDEYNVLGNCTFEVYYYADPGTWNCTMFVNDTRAWNNTNSDTITVADLLAVLLPSTINYGTVNATSVSNENVVNVTNVGNVNLNLTLSGYAVSEGDGQAMNCTQGGIKNISIGYEKYNLTSLNPGTLNLSQFEVNYTNLTGNPVTKEFNLYYRKNDSDYGVDSINQTYWRIYVPTGIGGTCRGNIVFGATQAAGS